MRLNHLGPDLIAYNGKVITVDDDFSISDAMAVKGERIIGIGGGDGLRGFAESHTRLIDLRGRAVIPGLIDGHAHMDREGLKDVYPSLEGARSIDDILQRIEVLVKAAEPGAWIVTMPIGDPPSYWDVPGILKERRFPNRHDLDRVAPNNPVYIRSIWGFWRHSLPLVSIANSKALRIARVTRLTESPCDSVNIEKDVTTGEPTGIFVENTPMPIVELSLMRAAGGFTHDDRVRGLYKAQQAYHAYGTTSIFEEHGVAAEVQRAYKSVWEEGGLTMRSCLVFSPSWETVDHDKPGPLLQSWAAWLAGSGLGDSRLRIAGLYGQLQGDSEVGSLTENAVRAAARPYTGWAGFNYDTALPREKLVNLMVEAARNDIRMVLLTDRMLDVIEEVNRVVPIADRRWVLGHIGVLAADQVKRIRDLGLVCSTHTNRNIFRTASRLMERLGNHRAEDISPLKRMKDAGIRFALATDNVPVSMFHPIWHSIARIDRETGAPVGPAEGLSREEALRAATIDGAYLTFEEHEKGSLEVGKLADFAVLSADPLTTHEDRIKDISADITVVGGKIAYERSGA